jgi:electron transfer flavoprotein alpha subunit
VLLADNVAYGHQLAENVALLVVEVGKNYSHVLTGHTTAGKNSCRASRHCSTSRRFPIIAVEGQDTFKRPIYAGNGIATIKSNDPIKVLSVRGTAFDPTAATGGSASIEALVQRSRRRSLQFRQRTDREERAP